MYKDLTEHVKVLLLQPSIDFGLQNLPDTAG